MDLLAIGSLAVVVAIVVIGIVAIMLRCVVPTNEVHLVQSSKTTTSYGNDTKNGNTYYEWPSWLPILGIAERSAATAEVPKPRPGFRAGGDVVRGRATSS